MKNTNPRASLIHTKLTQALSPTYLDVIDEGYAHIGHAEEGAGHFAVRLSSPLFKNKSLVACHQLVYSALDGIVGHQVHALRIEIIPSNNK